jgi:Ca2+-transporting ATPase
LCNDALMPVKSGQADPVSAVGDPTETALVEAAARFAFEKTDLEHLFPRVAEIPFEAERKRMTTVHLTPSSTACPAHRLATVWHEHLGGEYAPYVAFAKGAVDSLLEVPNTVCLAARHEPLSAEQRQRIVTTNDQLAQRGLRVLGVAYRPLTSLPVPVMIDTLEHDLVFLGMVGLLDPPRMEVKEAVQTCKTAGIRPVMITGDHPLTAQWIAQTLGIAGDGRVLTGQELGLVSAATLQELAADVSVYARVTPEHKLRIVQALQHCGHIIAMTGDGVNDAPALRQADIGIAMGAIGTDVAKEAADMILLDDNFATIVAAVEEGRVLYDNIRKFIKYTLSSNTGEIWVMLLAPLLGMPLPLVPLQILWINLLTDGLPGLALTVEPAEPNTLHRPPYPPDEPIFGRAMVRDILWVGLVIGRVPLGMGIWYWYANHPAWQTMIFTTLTLLQLGNALALRSQRDSLFRLGLLSNKALVGALAVTCILQLAVVYLPFLQTIFHTVALSAYDLALALIASTIAFWSVELRKWYQRWYAR